MNETQKVAWCNIFAVIYSFSFISYLVVQLKIRHISPQMIIVYIWFGLAVLMPLFFIYFVSRKQSPKEPDVDERDKQIKLKSWIAALISVPFIFLIASVVPQFFVGRNGYVPVWSLPLATAFLFVFVWLVYSIAVLIQYARGGKSNE